MKGFHFSLNIPCCLFKIYFSMKHHHVDNSDGSGDEETGPNIIDLGPVEYPSGEHRLQHPYCLWFSRRPSQIQASQVLFFGYTLVVPRN